MADAIKVSIGAALSSGFSAVFSTAESKVDSLGASVGGLKKKIGDVGAHQRLQKETLDLGNSLDEARKKTAEMRAEIAKSEKPTKDQTKALRECEKEEAKLTKALGLKEEALRSSSQALKSQGMDVSKLADEEKKLEQQLAKTEKRMAGRERFKKAFGFGGEREQKSVGEAFGNVKDKSLTAARDFIAVGAAVGGGMFMLAKGAADYGDEVAETASKIGISTKALQEFRAVGAGVGVDVETMDGALGKFSVNLGKAAASKTGSAEFAKMGLNLRQLIKMGPEKAMGKVAEVISRMPSHTKRAEAAVKIFGESGLGMLNVFSNGEQAVNGFYKTLGGGADALAKARMDVAGTGMVMSDEDIEKAGAYDDAMNRLQRTLVGVRNTVGIALVPVFTDLFTKLSDYVQNNGPQIKAFAENLGAKFGEMAPKLIDIGEGLGKFAERTLAVSDAAAKLVGGWDNLLTVMAVGRLAPVIASIWSLGASIWGGVTAAWAWAGGWAGITAAAGTAATNLLAAASAGWAAIAPFLAAAAPIIAVGAALVGVAFLVWKFWGPIKTFFTELFDSIINGAQKAIEWLKKLVDLGGAVTKVKEFLGVGGGEYAGAAAPATGASLAGQAITDAAKSNAAQAANVPLPTPRPGGAQKTETHTYQFKIDGAKNPEETARAVRQELQRIEREKAAAKRSSYTDKEAY